MTDFGRYQSEIYAAGPDGEQLGLPMTAAGLEAAARAQFAAETYAFVAGGAGAERTVEANTAAFARRRLVPRAWCGTSGPADRTLAVEVLGTCLTAPVLTAPIGALELLHPKGELIVAEVAAQLGIGFVLSTVASSTIEEIGDVGGPWWFQLYWPNDDKLAKSFVTRATAAGARAIVVTVDHPTMGWRPRDLGHAMHPFLQGRGVANYLSDPVFLARLGVRHNDEAATRAGIRAGMGLFGNHTLRPDDIRTLRTWTDVPIAVKGVQHPDDARAFVDAGCDAIVVSNHGGRQIDGAIASLDALAPIVEAVDGRTEVLFDSGVRTGSDVLVALASGASAVLYGRPWVYGLGLAGRDGVRHVLRSLLADLDITAGLVGISDASRVDRAVLAV